MVTKLSKKEKKKRNILLVTVMIVAIAVVAMLILVSGSFAGNPVYRDLEFDRTMSDEGTGTWKRTQTFDLQENWAVNNVNAVRVEGSIRIGPSELSGSDYVYVDVSTDEVTWEQVGVITARFKTNSDFTIPVDKTISYLRFRVVQIRAIDAVSGVIVIKTIPTLLSDWIGTAVQPQMLLDTDINTGIYRNATYTSS